MKNDELVTHENQAEESQKSILEEIIREGARKLLQAAVEQEVSTYIEMFKELKDERGKRMVVRHGFLPELSAPRLRLPLVRPGQAVQVPLSRKHLRY